MEKIDTLSDRKDTLKETTYRNLKKIYKMQAKSCQNIFRVYQNQDNFSIELEPREKIMSQTSFSYITVRPKIYSGLKLNKFCDFIPQNKD